MSSQSKSKCEQSEKLKSIKNLVLSGGGSKGFAYFGVYKALLELKSDFLDQLESITGTSAGAIVATLLALKYSPKELYSFITSFDYEKLKSWDIMNVFTNKGIETGESLTIFMKKIISKKFPQNPDPTFQDLYQFYPFTLNILVSHLNTYETIIYNHINTPNFSVTQAIRQSISIPIIFTPITKISEEKTNYYVDGGLINNFPIDIFPDSEETLGIILDSSKQEYEITNNEEYIYHVMMCAYHQMTLHKLKHYKKTQILEIDTQDIHAAQFDINYTTRKNLHDIGYQTTLKYFSDVADSDSPVEEAVSELKPGHFDSDESS